MSVKNFTGCLIVIFMMWGCSGPANSGFQPLFDGKTFDGWKVPDGDNGHWRILDGGIIDYDGQSEAEGEKHLLTEKSFRDFALKMDWRLMGIRGKRKIPVVLPDGTNELDEKGEQKMIEIDYAGDSGIYLRGSSKSQVNIWNWPIGSGEVYGYRNDADQPPAVRRGVTPVRNMDKPIGEWNTFVITLLDDRLTVELNGVEVIHDAQLPGIPDEGPFVLQHHGDPVQFRNIYIEELP